MYCMKCGKEIDKNESVCSNCKSAISSPKDCSLESKEDIIREAQICHLNDVLSLECAHKALIDKLNATRRMIDSLGLRRQFFAPHLNLSDDKNNRLVKCLLCVAWIVLSQPIFQGYVRLQICACVIGIIAMMAFFIYYTVKMRKKRNAYNHDKECFDKAVALDEKRVENELYQKKHLQKQYSIICEDLKKSYAILNDAYNANIIPAPYRNIYSVYYLKQFLSTSSISFSEALLHCNLDNIKTAVEGVIIQQQYMIVQQAVTKAINEKNMSYIIHQNHNILHRAAMIESNTRIAADYSRAAAVNSAASALFSSLTYFAS